MQTKCYSVSPRVSDLRKSHVCGTYHTKEPCSADQGGFVLELKVQPRAVMDTAVAPE